MIKLIKILNALVGFLLSLTLSTTLLATEMPLSELNEEILTFEQYGVPNYLHKFAISSMLQGDHVVSHTKKIEVVDDIRQVDEVYLVQTTDIKGNIDLRIKYDPAKIDERTDLIKSIEQITKREYQLSKYAEMYDRESVSLKQKNNSDYEISFKYSKYALPQDIANFRFMQGRLFISDGMPISLEVTNNKPFYQGIYEVKAYRQLTMFETLPNGRVVVNKKTIEIEGYKHNKEFQLHVESTPVVYYDDQLGSIVQDPVLLSEVSDPRMREAYVKLDRTFPLMADVVRRQGIDVPLPFGISASYRRQEMDFNFTYFNLGGIQLDGVFDPENTIANVTAESYTLRGDINILPFWNLFAFIGQVDVDAVVNAQTRPVNIGPIEIEPINFAIPIKLEYDLLGVGTTLAMGYKEYFASVTATHSITRLKGTTEDWGDGITTVQPMLGYQFIDLRTQLFIGAEYQSLNPSMKGELGPALGIDVDIDYDVGVNLDKWAYLIGFNKQIGKNYNLTALYNKGSTRSSITLNLGYRF
ncbi:hypothetical protein [Vibrio sp. ER1A]|uniref:hypothetical protein n=1 Tax=Vibrio sp. ER1A TaxID=1517681 RepID=UPI0004DD663D|nr:hypothetical protein [Vibrio sp. ER1A]KFA99232.1 hypothetical protein HW45_05050 [Vibrio sp. ER1A]